MRQLCVMDETCEIKKSAFNEIMRLYRNSGTLIIIITRLTTAGGSPGGVRVLLLFDAMVNILLFIIWCKCKPSPGFVSAAASVHDVFASLSAMAPHTRSGKRPPAVGSAVYYKYSRSISWRKCHRMLGIRLT